MAHGPFLEEVGFGVFETLISSNDLVLKVLAMTTDKSNEALKPEHSTGCNISDLSARSDFLY